MLFGITRHGLVSTVTEMLAHDKKNASADAGTVCKVVGQHESDIRTIFITVEIPTPNLVYRSQWNAQSFQKWGGCCRCWEVRMGIKNVVRKEGFKVHSLRNCKTNSVILRHLFYGV